MISKRNMQAVVLDLDGLMIDSETIAIRTWREFLAEYGKSLSDNDYRQIIGMEPRATAAFVRQRAGLPHRVEEIFEDHRSRMTTAIGEEAQAEEGLEPLIDELQARELPLAVASNSSLDYVERALTAIGLREVFQCVVASDHVERAKPAPDIYLEAASCLNIPPTSCLAVEDSPTGMRSALAAGMRCVVVPNHHLVGVDFVDAYATFDSLDSLRRNLDQIIW